jgi:hypothetical protein
MLWQPARHIAIFERSVVGSEQSLDDLTWRGRAIACLRLMKAHYAGQRAGGPPPLAFYAFRDRSSFFVTSTL